MLDIKLVSETRLAAFEEKNISSTIPVMLASGSERREGTDGLTPWSDNWILS
jgi:hypothetical protein